MRRPVTSAAMPLSASFLASCCSISVIQPLRPRGERFEPLGDDSVGVGIELAEREVLELLAHLLHAHAARERRIDVERLLRRAAARLRRPMRERAHVVQPVGELDQQHAHVVGDGEQELAQIFGLLRLLGDEIELLQLGQAFDQNADVVAEQAVDLGAGRVGVLDRVVQQRRGDGRVVELELGEDRGDLERVGEIRIAGGALLLAMRPHGIDIGAVEQILVGGGIVLLDPVDQVVLPHQSAACAALAPLLASSGTRLGPCATATRGRAWFCIRGKSTGERAIKSSAPPRNFGGADHKDIMTDGPQPQAMSERLPARHYLAELAQTSC